MTTPEQRAELLRLRDKATPGESLEVGLNFMDHERADIISWPEDADKQRPDGSWPSETTVASDMSEEDALYCLEAWSLAPELAREVEELTKTVKEQKREIFKHTLRLNYLAEAIKDGFHSPLEWLQKSEEHARSMMS